MINERLRQLRKQLGLTTRAFGESIGLSNPTISNIERGRRGITERTIRDICRIHDVNQDWLVKGTGPIFLAGLEQLNINEDVMALVRQYAQLTKEDKELIRGILNALCEKTRLKKAVQND